MNTTTASSTVSVTSRSEDRAAPPNEASRSASRLRWHCAGLAIVLLIAGVLRFGGITKVGIVHEDEGWYVSDARLWHRCASLLVDGEAIRAVLVGDKQGVQRRMDEIGIDFNDRYTKPSQGFTFLAALMMFVVGEGPAALLVTNALCGLLSVLVLYALGAVLFNRTIALCAAFVLATSPCHIIYCRSALIPATATLFILCGVLMWAVGCARPWPTRRTYLWSGLALGCAATCHYTAGAFVVMLAALDLFAVRGDRAAADARRWSVPDVFRRWAWLAVGVALPILALESVFLAGRLAAIVSGSHLPVYTYLEGVFKFLNKYAAGARVGDGGWINRAVPAAYAGFFVHWHGLVTGMVALFGVAITACARRTAKIPAALIVGTFCLLLLQRFLVARGLAMVVPFIYLCLAVGVYWISVACVRGRWARLAPVAAVALTVVLSVPAVANVRRVFRLTSDVEAACAFVRSQGGGVVVAPKHRKFSLYLEGSDVSVVTGEHWRSRGSPEQVLVQLREAGVRWLIIDPWRWLHHVKSPVNQWWQRMEVAARREASLAADFPHLSDSRWEFLSEGSVLSRLADMQREEGGRLRVYDLGTSAVASKDLSPLSSDVRSVSLAHPLNKPTEQPR